MSKNKQNTSVPQKELYGRMNFLYQASMLMAKQSNSALSAYYGRQCQSIGKKAQLRISPEVKRNFCKRCALAQHPGRTTDLEVLTQKRKKSKGQQRAIAEYRNLDFGADVFMKCRKCGCKRKFIVNTNYDFWLENPAAVEEIETQKIENTKNNDEHKSNIKNKSTESGIHKKGS